MLIDDVTLDGIPVRELSYCSERKVKAVCDNCKKELIKTWHTYLLCLQANDFSGITLCRACAATKTAKNRIGKPSPFKGKKRKAIQDITRKDYIAQDGYVMSFVYKENPKNKWVCYRKKHILIMEKELGRKLNPKEVVHHIDGDRLNNNLDNLCVLIEHKTHRLAHNSLQQIGYKLYKKGYILFDGEKYLINEEKFHENT